MRLLDVDLARLQETVVATFPFVPAPPAEPRDRHHPRSVHLVAYNSLAVRNQLGCYRFTRDHQHLPLCRDGKGGGVVHGA